MTPGRRVAAGCFVLLLHLLIVQAFIAHTPATLPLQPVVQVTLAAPTPPPRPQPPPLPLITPRTATLALPEVTILKPPPPSPAAPLTAPGPAAPADLPAPPAQKPLSDYPNRVLARLNAYKRYPHDAMLHHEQGSVRLHFRLDRSGHILFSEVLGGSGYASLDAEALAALGRAQPFPPPPPDFADKDLEMYGAVVFSLR